MPRWLLIGVVGVAAYFAWRKWGSAITSSVTKIAS